MPPVEDVGRGDTKTPPLWHTAAKMPSGRWYVDGSFHGRIPLMASSMELEKDRPFDALVDVGHPDDQGGVRRRSFVISVRRRTRTRSTRRWRRVARRFSIQRRSAARVATASTMVAGNVEWPGVYKDVGTDRARLDVVSDRFIAAFDQQPAGR